MVVEAPPHHADVTNREVGEVLGVTHSMISRIRSGSRKPSLALMTRIEYEFHWSVQSQAHNLILGTYESEFEQVLSREYGR